MNDFSPVSDNALTELMLVESYRLSVYVIPQYVDAIIDSVKGVVALKYGNYDGVCWCSVPGIERFIPREGGDPQAGEQNKEHSVHAAKIEFSIARDNALLLKVIEVVKNIHPWDEPVISINETLETRSNGVI